MKFFIPLNVAFYVLTLSHILAAAYAPIQDCDEVFNYWEPLHYLTHGYGLQTWEYSPEHALRSWLYIVIHAIPTKTLSVFSRSKTFEFYLVRIMLALVSAMAETNLYSAISRTLNPRIAIFYLMIVAFTPGVFYASVALLPSSFAMYTSTLGLAAFIDWRGGLRTAVGIMWFGIGALVGWPYAAFLIGPFIVEEVLVSSVTGESFEMFRRFLDGTVRSLLVMAIQVIVDTFFYHQVMVVPAIQVFYNLVGGPGKGPNIFGTEPWDYYTRNLLLNFNVWFVLAILAAPLLSIQSLFKSANTTKQTLLRTAVLVSPFYIWFGLFTLVPHKEERFMYPAYPFLALNAAISFHMLLTWLSSQHPKSVLSRISASVKAGLGMLVVLLALNVGFFRIFGTVTAYRAPLKVYAALESPGTMMRGETVCYGKEWYRFPSSFHLPNGARAKFVKSEFSGLLPGEFNEAKIGFGFFAGTWLVPPGMNDRNEEDPGKYTELEHCDYLVDSYMPESPGTELEPNHILNKKQWSRVSCAPFLDAAKTSLVARSLWTPDLPFVPKQFRRHWGEYCLLKRNRN